MRSWEAYNVLERIVKNMLTSLKAVSELQNPAIRERHWQQLMKSTKVNLLEYAKKLVTSGFGRSKINQKYFTLRRKLRIEIRV